MKQFSSAPLNQPSDDELMELVQKGDRASFSTIFKRHSLPVLRYALSLTGSMGDAQDLTQEVFLKAYAQRMAYRKMGIMKQWLFTICRNLQIDLQRRRTVRPIPMDLQKMPGQAALNDEPVQTREKGHFFSHPMIIKLPADLREVLFLRIVEELSYQEIATLTGKSVESLRQMVSRALKVMRTEREAFE